MIGQVNRIDVLPDDVLLEIFDFYVDTHSLNPLVKTQAERWQLLVHVCRRWRNLVFGSPRRLHLRLCCTADTPVRDTLDVWPALPLIVNGAVASPQSPGTDNTVAALWQSNRVCQVNLRLAGRQSEKLLAPMQTSFPELTDLRLFSKDDETPPVIPDSFLGGSAPPRLQTFRLSGISFPGLPKLLLSATRLVSLELIRIPHSGYISPETIVALISVLSSLKTLEIGFRSPQSRPNQSLTPPKRSILPALEIFYFEGVAEYLEELLTRIDTPQLYDVGITFFDQMDFDCPRLAQFVNRTPKLRAPNIAYIEFDEGDASVNLRYRTSPLHDLRINVPCHITPDRSLSYMERVCKNSFLHPLLSLEDLHILNLNSELFWDDDAVDNTLWLQLLRPFTAVINLYLCDETAPGVAAALQELVEGGITEVVLPNLQNIFVAKLKPWGLFQETIGQFATVRRRSGRPISISIWK